MTYTNPIIPGFYPDPSICRVAGDYFLVTSSFEYFPGVPLFHSRDLVNWRQIGHCLTRDSQLPLKKAWVSGGIYAPTIRYHDGRFYMVTTNTSGGGHFFVYTDDPFDDWSEPVWVKHSGIDPDLFFDGDDVYFTWSQRREGRVFIAQCRIDINTGEPLSEGVEIWPGTGGKGAEAPHLFRIGDGYYLMIAEGGTEYGHMETIARGPSPSGPWEGCPHNPILSHRSLASPIQATGHADLVEDPDGNWWMVFLGIRPRGYQYFHVLGRETFLAPVTLRADGWPVVNGGAPVNLEMDADLPREHVWPATPVTDNFDEDTLGLCWNFIRNPDPRAWSLSERPGHLALVCAEASLDSMEQPAWIGRRQQHHECGAAVSLDFDPQTDDDEAGLVVFQNMEHHYEIGVRRSGLGREAFVRRRIGRLVGEVGCKPVPDGPLELGVITDSRDYCFFFRGPDRRRVDVGDGECRYLSTEVGGRFTGVYFGMYATGNGHTSSTRAYFDWFNYLPKKGSALLITL